MFKQTDKINRLRYGNKLLKFFSNASDSSNVEEEIVKQINTLKPFNVEPHKAITKKSFASEEENNCEEEINLTPQRIGNIDL